MEIRMPTPVRARVTALAALLAALAAPLAAQEDGLARADALWARRGEGAQGGVAAAGPIREAVAAYESLHRARPDDLEVAWKLMRALWFQGDFATSDVEAKKAIYARGREVGERAVAAMGKRAAAKLGGKALVDLDPKTAAAAVRDIPEAARVYFWSAVNWGLWGDAFGKMAAARQGVGTRIRDGAETVILLDERVEEAGGRRVLGRLHSEAPKIPFVTGWVDRDKALAELRTAIALDPESRTARVWFAEAIVDHFPERRAEARPHLQWVIDRGPRPEHVVEDTRLIADARRLLGGGR
jgi:hypothetical protein